MNYKDQVLSTDECSQFQLHLLTLPSNGSGVSTSATEFLDFSQISSTGSCDVHASSKMVSPARGPNTGVQIKADLPDFSLVAEHSDQEER